MGLLEMSISASVLILLVAVLRKGKWGKLSGRTVMALWLVVLARLLLPGCLPIQHGIAAPVFRLLRRAGILYTDLQTAAGTKAAALAVPKAASFGTAGVADSSPLMELAFYTWLAGLAAAGICFAAVFRKEQRLLAEALPWEKMPDECKSGQEASFYRQLLESYQSASRLTGRSLRKKSIQILVHDRIPSPLVFGIVRQKIVIPKGMVQLTQTQMQHILTHEMVHIRRHDNLWKLTAAAAACIHWFNPAVWLMYLLFARDIELSCDERVLSMYGSQGRQEYAATLLALAQNQKRNVLFCSGFLENPVKERIVAIMKYKKLTGIGVLCTAMLLAGATSVFATNEQGSSGQEQKAQNTQEQKVQNFNIQETKGSQGETAHDANQDNVRYTIASTKNGETTAELIEGEGQEEIWVSFNQEIETDDGEAIMLKFKLADDGSDTGTYYYEDKDGNVHSFSCEKDDDNIYRLNAQEGTIDEGGNTDGEEEAWDGSVSLDGTDAAVSDVQGSVQFDVSSDE